MPAARHLALDSAEDHLDHIVALLAAQFPALGDLTPAQEAGPATRGSRVLMDTVLVQPIDGKNRGLYRPALRAQMPSACMRRRFPAGAFLDP